MTETPIYQGMTAGAQGQPVQPPIPLNPTSDIDAKVDALVAAKIADVEAKYSGRITQLEDALRNAAGPGHNVPEHAGGPGLEQAPTWSQYFQELARAGKLTMEHLKQAGMKVS
jgi:hypothetical protein